MAEFSLNWLLERADIYPEALGVLEWGELNY